MKKVSYVKLVEFNAGDTNKEIYKGSKAVATMDMLTI